MISYLQAARELDARWTGSLQFLPPTPCLRSADDCMVARQIATTEIDLFNRYAREIAAENGLKFSLLIDLHDMLLITGRMEAIERDEGRIGWRQPPSDRAVSTPAPKSSRTKSGLHRIRQHR